MISKRTKELAIEVGIGCVIVLTITIVALYSTSERPLYRWFHHWFGLVMTTMLSFGYPLREFRDLWRHRTFWLIFAALLAAHLTFFVTILWGAPALPSMDYAVTFFIEWMIIRQVMYRYRATVDPRPWQSDSTPP
jgi:hypothetical protein